ncbi:aminotransferase class V-fold PLP-dependent enzyme [Bryobacter aggregatus]|uniref:aminotransferase class V-fold PLP-dependent enzyme n=1 Tax=Bryobacter aggregatus TaxID=360054 RepID=UPI0004E1B488|nr:aminotransferase class V-fold PLP-dependent enzyme [Bryobacter aggregatus]
MSFEFPVKSNLFYLNHAAVAPLPRVAAEAMRHYADDAMNWGSFHYPEWMAAIDGVRTELSRMIGCKTGEVALVKNTSEGIATIQMGIDWKVGDVVVVFLEEFPANQYCWRLLEERKGCKLRWLSIYDPLEKIEEACRGARLLAVSWVNYLSGFRVDLKAIGEICNRHNVFYFVDAIQGLGAYPLDVKACGIHALAADGHKWLLGPEGWGVLYIEQEVQDQVFPVEFGWTTVRNWADYSSRDMTLRADAGRYEPGTLNVAGSFGLHASMKLLNDRGILEVSRRVDALAQHLADGLLKLGCELLTERSQSNGSGILSFRKDGIDSTRLHAALKTRKILSAPRQGWVRFSPHFYLEIEEMETVLDAVRDSLNSI